ncbi:uncharacterized protein C8Q71DRAFT_862998 [Rhodofomes roseus]|uniref:Hydrophobin n=1 Tax=Rhodofomes roseus TaxID=34475 RepID=A0ABQ8K0H1_9APHY|nr:uncharacterized protein C8Q71DRAFT_862998 [Rhodofomes roseus]KAH9829915.1 hypothetical protein C8Q71DRAFT_862998 [Rhodofomes roseus]
MLAFPRIVTIAFITVVAFANPWEQPTTTTTESTAASTIGQCNGAGDPQCCRTTTAGSATGPRARALTGVVVDDLEEVNKIGCSPLTIRQSCSYETVGRDDKGFDQGGIIHIGCVPVTL